jgi:fatty acid desaturase
MPALSEYAKELRHDLPAVAYQPARTRLVWLFVHLTAIGGATSAVLFGDWSLGSRLLISLAIGHSFACLAFLAHEILHGSVVCSPWLINLLGGLCFLPHCLPPEVWRTWHNRFHHGHTGIKGKDPDGFGSPAVYRRSRLLGTILTFLPGSGYLRSALYPLFYFSFHVLFVLFLHSRKCKYWSERKWMHQVRLFTLEVLFWITVATLVGPQKFFFIYLFPLMVANSIQMTYVMTNHWLCDETHDENDPLRNSLSVKLPRFIDWLHLNASYHTEHHLAPRVNPRYAKQIHECMQARHGDCCRRLPLLKILVMTFQTPRVHLSDNELVDLQSGDVYSTLGPHGEPPELIDQVAVPIRRCRAARSERELTASRSSAASGRRAATPDDNDSGDDAAVILSCPTTRCQEDFSDRRKAA